MIAAVVHSQRLADELLAERNRVTDARLAERARLRQDLHDGLGPALTGVGLGLEAVQRTAAAASDGRAAELLSRIRAEVAAALEEIRRIIDDLRPGALTTADLRTALEERAVAAGHAGVDVRVLLRIRCPRCPRRWRRRCSASATRRCTTSSGMPRRAPARSSCTRCREASSWWSATTGSGCRPRCGAPRWGWSRCDSGPSGSGAA